MKISKFVLKISLVWLAIVALVSINITYYLTNKSQKLEMVRTLTEKAHQNDILLSDLKKEVSIKLSREAQKQAPLSQEDIKNIDILNGGEARKLAGEEAADCSKLEKPWRRITNSADCSFVLKSAVGDLKLLIVQFVSPSVDTNGEDFIEISKTLNSDSDLVKIQHPWGDAYYEPSFNYLKTFFESEAKRFNAPQFSLQIDKTPIIELEGYPNYKGKTRDEQKKEFGVSQSFFLNELKKAKIDVSDYDAVAIVVYSKRTEGSDFFLSHAIPDIRANINALNVGDTAYSNVEVIAHETAHVFGASDQYIEDPNMPCCQCKEGAYDNYIPPKHINIMCGGFTIVLSEADSAMFNGKSAKEFGWLK